MRYFLLALGSLVLAMAFNTRAEAQNYPWCAQYGGADTGGAMNCGFVSFDQCMMTVRGMGGFCIENNRYEPPPGPHPPAKSQKRSRH